MEQKFEALKKEILDSISTVGNEFFRAQSKLEDGIKAKADGKSAYNSALDAGDETAMSQSLATIRAANEQIESAEKELHGFKGKVYGLREKVKDLGGLSKEIVSQVEANLKEVQKQRDKIVQNCGIAQCQNIIAKINELEDSMKIPSQSSDSP